MSPFLQGKFVAKKKKKKNAALLKFMLETKTTKS